MKQGHGLPQRPAWADLGTMELRVLAFYMQASAPPSIMKVAKRLDVERMTVFRCISRLRAIGLLTKQEVAKEKKTARPLVRFVPAEEL